MDSAALGSDGNGRSLRTNTRKEFFITSSVIGGTLLTAMCFAVAWLDHSRAESIAHDAFILKSHDDSMSLKELKDWRAEADPKIASLAVNVGKMSDNIGLLSNQNDEKLRKLNELLELAREAKKSRN